jgi:tetratricopeptide (TPR) repeat protein
MPRRPLGLLSLNLLPAMAFLLAGMPGRSSAQSLYVLPDADQSIPAQFAEPAFPPTPPPFPPTPPEGAIETTPPSFVEQGEQDFKAANYASAIRNWQHALVDSPDDGGVLLLLGQALFAQGRFDEEFLVTQRAMQKLPQNKWGEVIKNYSELYRGNQDYTDQLRVLERRRRASDSPILRFLLGYHYGYLGYSKEALRELDKGLEMAPQDDLARKLRTEFASKPNRDTPAAP